ncbi:MAG: nicotinate (nicotinamide) nucleotide adenylyltransferase [Acidimicrobiia bacterium]|nr:nicotinate (nicotinamide) nucleotide adenylyltransferase [Acidimicrobiia bacterium]
MSSVRRGLGILGGTFDPPHIGHIAAAKAVFDALLLERVFLMVANEPWQKVGHRPLSAPEDRLAMTKAAVVGIEGLETSDLEIRRGGPTYTIDSLEELRLSNPATDLFLILGADAAAGLDSWHRSIELPTLATLVIVERDGETRAEAPPEWSIRRVTMPRVDISSTQLRSFAARGTTLSPFVPESVIAEIESRGLYGLGGS